MTLLAIIFSVVMTPMTQTISLGQTAIVTAKVAPAIYGTRLNWTNPNAGQVGSYKGIDAGTSYKTNGISPIELPNSSTVSAEYATWTTKWTFTKQHGAGKCVQIVKAVVGRKLEEKSIQLTLESINEEQPLIGLS